MEITKLNIKTIRLTEQEIKDYLKLEEDEKITFATINLIEEDNELKTYIEITTENKK